MSRYLDTVPYSGATHDATQKRFYDNTLQSLVPTLFPLYDWFFKNKRVVNRIKPQGEKIYFGVETKMGSGGGPRGEGDTIAVADKVENVQGNVPYRRGFKGRIELSAEAMKFGKSGPGGFVDVTKQEMKGVVTTIKQHNAPAMWGDGTGILAKVAAIDNSTAGVPTVSEGYQYCYPGARWLAEGMKVIGAQAPDTRDSETGNYTADSDMSAAVEIDSINSDISITFASAVTLGNTDTASRYLYEYHASGNGSVTLGTASSYRGPQGMLALCHDGSVGVTSYCGISESTYPNWKAVINDNSGTTRSLTLDLIYRLWSKLSRKTGTFEPKLTMWMNFDVLRTFTGLLEHYLEFKPRDFKPGFDKYDVMVFGNPIRVDHYCPSYVFFLNPSYITLAEGCPIQVARETGSMWRFVADKDVYQAVWRWIYNTYSTARNKHGIIKDLDVTIASI